MDKWLEELKRNKEDDLKVAEYAGVTLTSEEYKRLIQQAERVQKLEERNAFLEKSHQTNIKIAEYAQQQNQRYEQALEEINFQASLDETSDNVQEAIDKALKGGEANG